MYHVSAQGVGERMINVHDYYHVPTYVALHEMRWHAAWLYDVHRMCADAAAVSRGTSYVTTETSS